MQQTLHDLFIHELKDIYSAELQVASVMPEMIAKAQDLELKEGLGKHLEQTKNQINRLETIASQLDFDIKGETCKGIHGLIEEGKTVMEEFGGTQIGDSAIVGAANKIEHYEIAAYGTAIALAAQMAHDSELELLEATLTEEEETDAMLSELAETKIHVQVPTGH